MLDLLDLLVELKDLLSQLFQLYNFLYTTQMLLISALYLIDHKKEALGVKLLFNFWFFNECIIKWKLLKQSFLLLFYPKN